MKTAKRIILLIAIGLFPSILLAEGEPPLSASVPQDSDYSISQAELKKGRPANGFKLVYSENDAVCQPVLAALNEPGYDSRYFNQSDKFENTLPELLIQTRLNVPRTLIGTHLYRTEEYEIKDAESGNKEYWYRLIGQGSVILGRDASQTNGWFEIHSHMFSDFLDFVDEKYKNIGNLGSFDLYDFSSEIVIALGSDYQSFSHIRMDGGFIELIEIDNKYYIVTAPRNIQLKNSVYIIVAETGSKYFDELKSKCFIKSFFLITDK